ncbi:MAG: hypothetical protein A3K19_13695 [Lentisphaerae bacterium RIFOXYB12_FULL_65_16]|nr:MAG: hypothetical protein A3K18_17730 [Lentisphaerae bacterium RIFOXYA12_64_32]OGV94179.1 MAG: hypothetical protein A3K19_13695 [Lentisphaerae bacterium RIFOXYB12_FULL_65_16]
MLAICRAHGIEPILIGGMALDAYTASRATMDIDLLADCPPECLGVLRADIVAAGGRVEDSGGTRMLRAYVDGIQVDLLRAWDAEARGMLARAESRQCLGIELRVPSLIDFVVNKLRTGRPRDVDDAIRLVENNRDELDLPALEGEVRRLLLHDEWQILREALDI